VRTGISLATIVFIAAASAAGAEENWGGSFTLERHHTTNALDSSIARSDWYTLMRGALQSQAEAGSVTVNLKGEVEAKHFDRQHIEDDISGALTASATTTIADRVELRGTVAWKNASEGDDLWIEDIVLGTRTPTNRFIANIEAGTVIGPDRTLVLELANSHERNGDTRFEDDLIEPTKLEADRFRHRLTAALTQKSGAWSHGLRGFGGLVLAQKLGDPPIAASLAEFSLRAETAGTLGHGITMSGSLGLELLAELDGKARRLVPVSKIAFEIPLGTWARLSPQLESRVETDDTDDPLGSWVRRAQAEIAVPLAESITLGAGVYVQSVDNLTLDYDERGFGAYGEIALAGPGKSKLVLRGEYSEDVYMQVDGAKRTLDTFVGFRTEL
jgi:hypothetical protein